MGLRRDERGLWRRRPSHRDAVNEGSDEELDDGGGPALAGARQRVLVDSLADRWISFLLKEAAKPPISNQEALFENVGASEILVSPRVASGGAAAAGGRDASAAALPPPPALPAVPSPALNSTAVAAPRSPGLPRSGRPWT